MKSNVVPFQRRIPKNICPFPGCPTESLSPDPNHLVRNGTFYRRSDKKYIPRYRCKGCKKGLSDATLDPCYRQKKRTINFQVEALLVSKVHLRECARLMGITFGTVIRKKKFLAAQRGLEHQDLLNLHMGEFRFKDLQFDEMETYEHSRMKPVSIPLIVHGPTRLVLGVDACSMPAKSLLAHKALAKYGVRKNLRTPTLESLFESLSNHVNPKMSIRSDSCPWYPKSVRKYFPDAKHETVLSRAACVAGHGELKKGGNDPLFSLNHTAAMFRDHMSRLIRRTWCGSKKIGSLREHLILYMAAHNRDIIETLKAKNRLREFLPALG